MLEFIFKHCGKTVILALLVASVLAGFLYALPLPTVIFVGVVGAAIACCLVGLLAAGCFFARFAHSSGRGAVASNDLADIIQETKDYNIILRRIADDRVYINQSLVDIHQRIIVLENWAHAKFTDNRLKESARVSERCLTQTSNSYGLFSEQNKLCSVDTRDSESYKALSDTLDRLRQTYPEFDRQQRNDTAYMKRACKELSEHHLLVVQSANHYIKETGNTIMRLERQLTELSRVITPGLGPK